jgi:hypothetical protein
MIGWFSAPLVVNKDGTVTWPSKWSGYRRSLTLLKVAAAAVLVEQFAEVLVYHLSLAEHPTVIIACLGALGLPVPKLPAKDET